MAKRAFKIWRGDDSGGSFESYETEISEGMVVAATRKTGDEAEDVAVLRCDREMPNGAIVS